MKAAAEAFAMLATVIGQNDLVTMEVASTPTNSQSLPTIYSSRSYAIHLRSWTERCGRRTRRRTAYAR